MHTFYKDFMIMKKTNEFKWKYFNLIVCNINNLYKDKKYRDISISSNPLIKFLTFANWIFIFFYLFNKIFSTIIQKVFFTRSYFFSDLFYWTLRVNFMYIFLSENYFRWVCSDDWLAKLFFNFHCFLSLKKIRNF